MENYNFIFERQMTISRKYFSTIIEVIYYHAEKGVDY